jgi:hypothetical protein
VLRGPAQNPAMSNDVLLLLLEEWPKQACEGLRHRRDLPRALQNAMLSHPMRSIRRTLARNLGVAPQIRGQSLSDPNGSLCSAAFGVPGQRPVKDDVLVQLLSRITKPFQDAAVTSDELWFELFDCIFRCCEIKRLLRLAATHSEPEVLVVAASNSYLLSDPMVQALLADPVSDVREAVQDVQRVIQITDLDVRVPTRRAWVLQRPFPRIGRSRASRCRRARLLFRRFQPDDVGARRDAWAWAANCSASASGTAAAAASPARSTPFDIVSVCVLTRDFLEPTALGREGHADPRTRSSLQTQVAERGEWSGGPESLSRVPSCMPGAFEVVIVAWFSVPAFRSV